MKRLMYSMIVVVMTIIVFTTNVYGYENDIFKIDVPSDYSEMSYSNIHMFIKSEDTGIMIYTVEANGLKKNLSTMSKSEIEELINGLVSDTVTVIEQKKEKLGKSKAIKARVTKDDEYMDMYILVSDKHIVLVSFTANTEAELDSNEYLEIKKSFKMKEKTTNTTLVKLGIVALVGVGAFFKFRRRMG